MPSRTSEFTNDPVLSCPNFEELFVLQTYTSTVGSCILERGNTPQLRRSAWPLNRPWTCSGTTFLVEGSSLKLITGRRN